MIVQIENSNGIISYDNSLIEQLISDAFEPFKNSYKLIRKTVSMEPEGLQLNLDVHIKFGTSINNFSNTVLEYIAKTVENNLELPVKSIVLHISAVYSKKLSKRDIYIEYNNESGIINHSN